MAMGFGNAQYNPGQVMLGGGGNMPRPIANPIRVGVFGSGGGGGTDSRPYLPNNKVGAPSAGGTTVGPQAVRATGTGPYDSAYRQNLATYAGGLFSRPGGTLAFNPTDPNAFQGMGQPTGGGNAPVSGAPTGLLDQALGGSPFSFTPQAPQAATPQPQQPTGNDYWKFWLNQYGSPLNNMRPAQGAY